MWRSLWAVVAMLKRLLLVWTVTLLLSGSAFAQQSRFYFVANRTPPDDFLELRTSPSYFGGGQLITKMDNGTLLQVLKRQPDGWCYVQVVSTSQQGWAFSG